jgi:spermidine synthase
MIHLLVIGLISILGQAVLLRELTVAFYGIELIYVLALGVWLIWTAAGAMTGRRNLNPSESWIGVAFILFSILLPADVVYVRSIRAVFSAVPGAYLPFSGQIAAMSAALLPPGLLSGLIFQWAAKLYLARGQSLARAYALESIGGLAGGLMATLFLRYGISNLAIAFICALLSLGAAAAVRAKKARLRAAATAVAVVVFLLLGHTETIDRQLTGRTHPGLQATQDTPYGRITVTKQGSQIAVYENDALSFETEGIDAEEFVHVAALMHPQPVRVLILGGGTEGNVREMLKHAPSRVDYVELNPAMLTVVEPSLPAESRKALQAPQVRVTIADGRRFLDGAGRYDLILIGMPEPESGQANRYYTQEFFRQCASHLESDGILAFRLRSGENFWASPQAGRAVSIYRALKSALPKVVVLPGEANVFAASGQPLPLDPGVLSARLQARAIATRLVSAPYIRYLFTGERFSEIAHVLDTVSAPVNTDAHPICYQYTLLIWLSKFYPTLAAIDFSSVLSRVSSLAPALWITALALPLLFVLRARRPHLSRVVLVGTAAFIGMALETLLVLYYQVKSGILYQDIGILLTGFMAGLALGAMITETTELSSKRGVPLWYGWILWLGFALLGAVTGLGVRSGMLAGLAEVSALLFFTGLLVAGIFAYAGFDGGADQRSLVAPLYAADLLGGCIGSVAATLLLIPVLGMVSTAAFMVPPALLCLVLLHRQGHSKSR